MEKEILKETFYINEEEYQEIKKETKIDSDYLSFEELNHQWRYDMEKLDIEEIIISKEDFEKYFNNRKIINKEEYIKYLYDNKKLKW